jgi:hypothetical protein
MGNRTVYGKAQRKTPLEHRIVKYNTSNDGNNKLVILTSFTEDNGFVAHVFATQYAPDVACLLYRFNVGRVSNYEEAIAVACKLLAEKLRLAATYFDSKFIKEKQPND